MSEKLAGHKFLARMGKKRLRPGGRAATEWLMQQGALTPSTRVLEVACNMGTTAIEIAQRYGCSIVGVDMDKAALLQARQNILTAGVEGRVTVMEANALALPFPDNHFDVVINEAMLTMYADKAKRPLIQEYLRVLKPGGRLLTHDIMLLPQASGDVTAQMRAAINVNVQPLTLAGWRNLFLDSGFSQVENAQGAMTLMTPSGMIYDEGWGGAVKIVRNALKAENRATFLRLFRTFRRYRHQLNYIAICSTKGIPQ